MKKQKIKAKQVNGGYEVMINFVAPIEIADGYLEFLSGAFLMSGILLGYSEPCKKKIDDTHIMLSQTFILKVPPLGSMGLDDIRPCPEDT